MFRLSTLPWVIGLTSSVNKVGSAVGPSGVPLQGGLAHRSSETIPNVSLFRVDVLTSPAGQRVEPLMNSIEKLSVAVSKKNVKSC